MISVRIRRDFLHGESSVHVNYINAAAFTDVTDFC